ncbi:MAG: serine/threonine-protein kinase [Actinomycetota bacterium]
MTGGRGTDLGIPGLEAGYRLGEGGFAVVYRARQTKLDRDVAVKILKDSDEATLRRFDREQRAMGRLSQHDGIVTVYESGVTTHGEPYLIMPLLGDSLDDELRRRGAFAWDEAVRLMAEVASTVGYAHEQSVIHRDLKPENIMRTASGRALVADFGISRITEGLPTMRSTKLTFSLHYSPPESFGDVVATPQADVYSLGATLYALIAGHAPFRSPGSDPSVQRLINLVMHEPIPALEGQVPVIVNEIVARATAKLPEDRYPTATEFAFDLRDALDAPARTRTDELDRDGPEQTAPETIVGGARPQSARPTEPTRAGHANEAEAASAPSPNGDDDARRTEFATGDVLTGMVTDDPSIVRLDVGIRVRLGSIRAVPGSTVRVEVVGSDPLRLRVLESTQAAQPRADQPSADQPSADDWPVLGIDLTRNGSLVGSLRTEGNATSPVHHTRTLSDGDLTPQLLDQIVGPIAAGSEPMVVGAAWGDELFANAAMLYQHATMRGYPTLIVSAIAAVAAALEWRGFEGLWVVAGGHGDRRAAGVVELGDGVASVEAMASVRLADRSQGSDLLGQMFDDMFAGGVPVMPYADINTPVERVLRRHRARGGTAEPLGVIEFGDLGSASELREYPGGQFVQVPNSPWLIAEGAALRAGLHRGLRDLLVIDVLESPVQIGMDGAGSDLVTGESETIPMRASRQIIVHRSGGAAQGTVHCGGTTLATFRLPDACPDQVDVTVDVDHASTVMVRLSHAGRPIEATWVAHSPLFSAPN